MVAKMVLVRGSGGVIKNNMKTRLELGTIVLNHWAVDVRTHRRE